MSGPNICISFISFNSSSLSVCIILVIKFLCKGEVAFTFVNSGGLTFSSIIFKAMAQHGWPLQAVSEITERTILKLSLQVLKLYKTTDR